MGYHLLLAALIAALLGAGAGSSGAAAQAAPVRVIAYTVEPFIYQVDGKPAGLEYEILEHLATASGRTLEVRWTDRFADVLAALDRGDADVAAATITITPERLERFAFTVPYMPVRVLLVEPAGRGAKALDDLRGATLATVKGTTYEALLSKVPDARLLYAGSEEEQFEMVASGRARALAVDSTTAYRLIARYPNLEVGIPLTPAAGYGFAFPTGSALAPIFSGHLERLKESNTFYALVERHLGEDAVLAVKGGRAAMIERRQAALETGPNGNP
jgi:ABC-type amino acid transport substrate-binding protein